MKSAQYTREELLQENRRLIKNLRARFKRQMGVELSAPIYAQTKFNETLQNIPRDLRQLDDRGLRDLYRDLTYIGNLKTATKQGAERAEKQFEPIRQFLEPFSEETRKEWWKVFNKIYHQLGEAQAEMFKYEVLDVNRVVFQKDNSMDGVPERFLNVLIEYTKNTPEKLRTGEGLKIRLNKEFGLTNEDYTNENGV